MGAWRPLANVGAHIHVQPHEPEASDHLEVDRARLGRTDTPFQCTTTGYLPKNGKLSGMDNRVRRRKDLPGRMTFEAWFKRPRRDSSSRRVQYLFSTHTARISLSHLSLSPRRLSVLETVLMWILSTVVSGPPHIMGGNGYA